MQPLSSSPDIGYDDPASPPRLCQNCHAPLRGPYCARCGQHDVDYHRSFHHLIHDLLENLLHFEGKLFASVAWLLASPGRLTQEFNAGRRASQLNPVRFYLFVSVLFFLGVHWLNHGHLLPYEAVTIDPIGAELARNPAALQQIRDGLAPKQLERLAELVREESERSGGGLDERAVRELIARVRAELPLSALSDAPPPNRMQISVDPAGGGIDRKFQSGEVTISEFLGELESRVPTLLFLGMPVFALLLKVVFRRSGRFYIEHLIFSVHLHTWVFLVFMVSTGYLNLLGFGPGWLVAAFKWALAGWMGWYLLSAFRVVYGQTWPKAALKLGLTGAGYSAALLLMTGATVFWTLMKLTSE